MSDEMMKAITKIETIKLPPGEYEINGVMQKVEHSFIVNTRADQSPPLPECVTVKQFALETGLYDDYVEKIAEKYPHIKFVE